MSWFHFRQRKPRRQSDISALHSPELEAEKTRTEIEQMRVQIDDSRAWFSKLGAPFIVPAGTALAFCLTWAHNHAVDHDHHETQLYVSAAQQLDSPSAAIRLNAVHLLDAFVPAPSLLSITSIAKSFHRSPTQPCDFNAELRKQDSTALRASQSVALIIGRLSQEQEASVLDAISQVAQDNPCLTVAPLLSVDRSAAVDFARAAGNFAAVYMLHKDKKISLDQGGPGAAKLSQQIIDVIDAVTTRTGSPFEARSQVNQVFVAGPMLSISASPCPFAEIYDKQFELTATALNSPALSKPPSADDLAKAMRDMEKAAAMLEKVSFVLQKLAEGHLAGGEQNIAVLQQLYDQRDQRNDLYGVAIVIGEYKDVSTIKRLQAMGAFVQHRQPGDGDSPNTCPPHSVPAQ